MRYHKIFFAVLISLAIVFTVFFGFKFFSPEESQAASAFLDPNGDGSQSGVQRFNCAGFFACVDDAIRQPNTPNTTDYVRLAIGSAGFYQMTSTPGAVNTTQIEVWVYHRESKTNTGLAVELWDDTETVQYGSTVNLPFAKNNQWNAALFTGLTLSQAQLDGLKVKVLGQRIGPGGSGNILIFSLYADVAYSLGGYALSGTYISSSFNAGKPAVFNMIEWQWSKTNDACSSCNIKFQIQTAPDAGGSPGIWSSTWSGPEGEDGDETDYFTVSSGQLIHTDHNGDQWIRYRAILEGDGQDTPILEKIIINYK